MSATVHSITEQRVADAAVKPYRDALRSVRAEVESYRHGKAPAITTLERIDQLAAATLGRDR